MRKIILLASMVLSLSSCTSTTSTPAHTNPPLSNSGITITGSTSHVPTTPTPVVTASGVQKTVTTPTYGTGKTQVEIFADFQCPACIQFNEVVQPIFEEYASQNKITIVYRQYPLSKHKNAFGDALAALCAQEQGKYLPYKKALYMMEKQKSGAAVSDGERIAIAKDAGIETESFGKCLASQSYENQVQSDMARGDSLGIEGTPTIYLDGVKVDMSLFRDVAGFRAFIESKIR